MSFVSVDELNEFRFDDCVISKMCVAESMIEFELEALIVKCNNSQNTNFTESYAGTAIAKFKGGKILSGAKDGYKYFDANGNLVKEVPDVELSDDELKEMPKLCEGAYLYKVELDKEEDGLRFYSLMVEFTDEFGNSMDSYQIRISCEKTVISWDRYLNKVQN